jgi:hypothetical protein
MNVFYSKELCTNKFFVNNVAVPFECQPSNTGCIALDSEKDAALIAALDDAIAKRKGGIGKIDASTYEAIKKNKTGKVSVAFSPKERLQTIKVPSPFAQPKSAAPAAVESGVRGGASGETGNSPAPTGTSAPFVPARGRVLNDADKTNPPGTP